MSGFANAVVGGMDILKRNAIRSFNYVAGVSGWSINKDGTAQFNQLTIIVQANGAAVLIYFPAGGQGNLIGSWAAAEFTDQYGNDVPAGLNVQGGILNAVALNAASMIAGTITNTLLNACTIANSNLVSGTSFEQTITFDSSGGLLVAYSTTTTTVTQTANGTYTQTLPAGVTTINNVQVWGAGAGGDGGSTSVGGNGGGAGEFGGESVYTPTTNPFSYVVGNGGNNSTTGQGHGADGGDSFLDGVFGVVGHGGDGNGTGGTGSLNTVHHNGGSAPNAGSASGGASGGNSGNPTSAGNNGNAPAGATGGVHPTAQTNSGEGGDGGNNGANAVNGTAPGGGGGGAGKGTSTTGSKTVTYAPTWVASYYGPDGSTPNARRSTTAMYQGGETSGGGAFNGNMRSVFAFNRAQMASDFAGYTITGCSISLVNQHSWFNSGMTIEFDEYQGLPGSAPSTMPAGDWRDAFGSGTIAEGATHTYTFATSVINRFISGSSNGFGIGFNVASDHPYDLNYYGWFSDVIRVKITGTISATGSTSSGTGADGKVSFQFTTAQALLFALSAVAGTDSGGNAFAAGYTGPVTALQPGAAPSVVETWHNITLDVGWSVTVTPQYRMLSNGQVELRGQITHAGVTTLTNINGSNPLPSAYWPPTTRFVRSPIQGDQAGTVAINTAGIIQMRASGFTAVAAILDGIYTLT